MNKNGLWTILKKQLMIGPISHISASFSLMSAASFLSAAPPGSYLRSVRMSIGAKESGGDVQS
jgi:hypothetical protein